MITARGKLQRVAAGEISIVGRNTQGVRIMNLGDDDSLVAVKRMPKEEGGDSEVEAEIAAKVTPPENTTPPEITPPEETNTDEAPPEASDE